MGNRLLFSTTTYCPTDEQLKREIDVLLDEMNEYTELINLTGDPEYVDLRRYTVMALKRKVEFLQRNEL